MKYIIIAFLLSQHIDVNREKQTQVKQAEEMRKVLEDRKRQSEKLEKLIKERKQSK